MYTLLEPAVQRAANDTALIDLATSGETTVSNDEFNDLRIRTALQIRRLELGLDGYGNSRSFVPMLTYESYDDYISRWLVSAEKAEQQYEKYFQARENEEEAMLVAKEAVVALDAAGANFDEIVMEVQEQLDRLQTDIAVMLVSVQEAAAELLASSENFREAVEREANKCEFAELIRGIGAVVAITQFGLGTITSVGSTIAAVKKHDTDTFKHLGTIAKQVEVVGKNVNELEGAYNKLRAYPESGLS